jgi:hypothetical protein
MKNKNIIKKRQVIIKFSRYFFVLEKNIGISKNRA